MPKRGSKRGVRKGGRRLQPTLAAMAASTLGAAAAGTAAHIASTFTAGKRRGRGPDRQPRRRPGNLRGAPNAPSMMRANTEGYIPNISHVVGNSKKGLSFTEKIQKVINPPQTLMYNTTSKLEATSGLQGVSSFTINNSYFVDFFLFMAATKSDNSGVNNGIVDTASVSNTVNHLWTSVQNTFMNSGTTAAELDIYVYRALQDMGSTDQTVSAAAAWAYSEAINGANGIAADGTDRVGKKPTDASAKFLVNRYWKLVKKNSITMKPGESFKHYYCEHYNTQYARFMLQGDNTGITKRHSLSYVFVLRGQVVGSSTSSAISTGDAQISCVRTVKLQHCHANSVRPRDMLIGTDLTTIAPALQTIINTDKGTQETGYVEDA